jgi:geranylgeranyl pyrophosphate synthase
MTDAVRSALAPAMLAAIEDELRACLVEISDERHRELAEMVRHHFGWHPAGGERVGKRVRPLLTLLTASAAGGDWMQAVPAAASIELIHNFTLIHDDIEDSSETRRGRPTVWSRWGVPQAVNTGDFVYVASHLACHRLTQRGVSVATVHAVQVALDRACLDLTLGQHLDLAFERREKVGAEDYLEMISGKTAALLAAAAAIGAQAAEAAPAATEAYHQFGWNLGMAFQLLDDLLGIWGADRPGIRRRRPARGQEDVSGAARAGVFGRIRTRVGERPVDPRGNRPAAGVLGSLRGTAGRGTRAQGYTREAMRAWSWLPVPGGRRAQDLAQRLLQRDR